MQRICLNGLKSGQIACKPQAVNMAVYRPQLWRAFACIIAILIGLSGTALAQFSNAAGNGDWLVGQLRICFNKR